MSVSNDFACLGPGPQQQGLSLLWLFLVPWNSPPSPFNPTLWFTKNVRLSWILFISHTKKNPPRISTACGIERCIFGESAGFFRAFLNGAWAKGCWHGFAVSGCHNSYLKQATIETAHTLKKPTTDWWNRSMDQSIIGLFVREKKQITGIFKHHLNLLFFLCSC